MRALISEAGAIPVPPELMATAKLQPGQSVEWEQVSPNEFRVVIPPVAQATSIKPDPMAALGFAQKHGLEVLTTEEWMKILREGEED